ncbi:ABC transporter permease [Clostridium sp. MSJ-11]|uniref:ABC transporter permease n=1 Tax=Clostridium mobile TaxID=2841512 RepID=A0ABS6EH18_9CLOT|nr:ABC transporter permease [Clostridium mobile]MBU5484499.1 ABC transporter permease [Clostridium mobile]
MYNGVYCEFLKLKRSPIIFALIIGAVIEPLLMLMVEIYLRRRGHILQWDIYMINTQLMTFLIAGLIVFTLVASYIYSREFAEKVEYTAYSYPLSKTKIFICKLITVFGCIAFVYALQFITILITGIIIDHGPLEKDFLILSIKIYGYSMLFQFAIAPLGILIASVSRNSIVPMIYSIIGTIAVFAIERFGKDNTYFPLSYPVMPILSAIRNDMKIVINSHSIIIAVMFFIITSALCIIYYKKSDIAR